MVYCAAGCNQEPLQAMVAQIISHYRSVDDWRASTMHLMYGKYCDPRGRAKRNVILSARSNQYDPIDRVEPI